MKQLLKISETLSLPLDAVTKRLAWLGTTGSGKTYGFLKLAEEMLAAKVQLIILDPVGVHYGLRMAKNGKSPGISIPVFGGLHGDIPLEPSSGKLIADLIVDRGISAIIDVSQFEYDTDKATFAAEFGNRLFFRKKSKPSALHVGLEEAQEFIPQNPQRGEERMLHVWNRIAKVGRNYGFGLSMISQRPQEINKKALNLSQCLFAFQTIGHHEREAIEAWIKDKRLDLDIAQDLPRLEVGAPHVWSPGWLKISETVRISERWTFDASETPTVGQRKVVKELAPIDLENLKKEMQSTIEKAKADDPKLLRKRIDELERQLKQVPKNHKPNEKEINAIIEKAKKATVAEIRKLFDGKVFRDSISKSVEILKPQIIDSVGAIARGTIDLSKNEVWLPPAMPFISTAKTELKIDKNYSGELPGVQQRIIDSLAWWKTFGHNQVSREMCAYVAMYSPRSSSYMNSLGALRTKEMIIYASAGMLELTSRGQSIARAPQEEPTAESLFSKIMNVLDGVQSKIFQALWNSNQETSRAMLAEMSGYSSQSSSYMNALGRLRTLKLCIYKSSGIVQLSDWIRELR